MAASTTECAVHRRGSGGAWYILIAMDIGTELRAFWHAYIADAPQHAGMDMPAAEGFGIGPEMADKLGALIMQGTKTATCSLLWEYEHEGEPVPHAGQLTIVTAGDGRPLCLIETCSIEIRQFADVDAQFAYEEGEGDRSLAYWRDAHWRFFTQVCDMIGRTPSEDMPLVCERFRVLARAPSAGV